MTEIIKQDFLNSIDITKQFTKGVFLDVEIILNNGEVIYGNQTFITNNSKTLSELMQETPKKTMILNLRQILNSLPINDGSLSSAFKSLLCYFHIGILSLNKLSKDEFIGVAFFVHWLNVNNLFDPISEQIRGFKLNAKESIEYKQLMSTSNTQSNISSSHDKNLFRLIREWIDSKDENSNLSKFRKERLFSYVNVNLKAICSKVLLKEVVTCGHINQDVLYPVILFKLEELTTLPDLRQEILPRLESTQFKEETDKLEHSDNQKILDQVKKDSYIEYNPTPHHKDSDIEYNPTRLHYKKSNGKEYEAYYEYDVSQYEATYPRYKNVNGKEYETNHTKASHKIFYLPQGKEYDTEFNIKYMTRKQKKCATLFRTEQRKEKELRIAQQFRV
ncbi:46_t:CDS:2 [Ambispora gerdemannii]|uniref:46_t:CDS:1 n=1 Tax=Ambispora gerdemannii TaxID=144530 RepID=A0A9N9D5M1_9GLOM|nr:46_t:CDS:2 [Ambispora gerdemannii]